MSKVKKAAHSTKEVSSSSSKSSSSSSDEEIDAHDLKPIKDYLPDRRELARQLFKSVKTEKIRMMLPQVLKKIDLTELEDRCASELNGMSKTRILCILNGETMLESSDTCDLDDSGPSLEIISDTEEWFSDDNTLKKVDGEGSRAIKMIEDKMKFKGKANKRTDMDKLKAKSKLNSKGKNDTKQKDVKIKKEDKTKTNKDKEGDSLLDLLELEMRARAIRALIRKEEDVIPTPNTSKYSESSDKLSEHNVSKTAQDELSEKENCQMQLEKIIGTQQPNSADDEDVVLVTQPTPTIELLSSDSEHESNNGIRINQKLENERTLGTSVDNNHVKNENVRDPQNTNTNATPYLKEHKKAQQMLDTHRDLDTSKFKLSKRVHSDSVETNNGQLPSISKSQDNTSKKRRVKKKSRSKEELKKFDSDEKSFKLKRHNGSQRSKDEKASAQTLVNSITEETENTKCKNESNHSVELKVAVDNLLSRSCNDKEEKITTNEASLDEEKSIDLEEIIDLDNYCDDMDDMEMGENDESKNKSSENEQRQDQASSCSDQKTVSTETWASRYYQTDDVQNVIRESKIQSEIRKRLRERQRLFKLNKSPNSNSPVLSPANESTGNKSEEKTMGSVNEYLALKRTASVNLSVTNSSNGITTVDDSNVHNDMPTDTNTVITNSCAELTDSKEADIDKGVKLSNDVNTQPLKQSTSEETKIVDTNNGINPG